MKVVYKRYQVLIVEEHPNSGIRDTEGNFYSRFQIFNFMLSSYGGTISIEKIEPVKNLAKLTNIIQIPDINRFFYLFLHITMRKMITWAQQHYSAHKIYFDSSIDCFPDVTIDLKLPFRGRALGIYENDRWHAVANIRKIKKEKEIEHEYDAST